VAVKLRASQSARDIARVIRGLSIGDVGSCNEAHAFDHARQLLEGVAPSFVITLTDGIWSCRDAAKAAARACIAGGIESIAIGFGTADRTFLREIASSDEASFFTSLSGLVETFTSIAQVLTESQGGTVGQTAARPARLGFLDFLRR
jgi:molecular chaperone DnaK